MSDDDILGNEQRNGHMTLAKQEKQYTHESAILF